MQWVWLITVFFVFPYNVHGHAAVHPRDFLSHAHYDKDDDSDRTIVRKHNPEENKLNCSPLVSCPAHVRSRKNNYCVTLAKRKGIVCSTGQNHTEWTKEKRRGHHDFHADILTLENLSRKSKAEMAKLRRKEELLLSKRSSILHPGSATYGHFRNSRRFGLAEINEVMNVADRALEIAIATRFFKDRQGVTNDELEVGILNQDLRSTVIGHNCIPRPVCPLIPDKYRRIDGACNNIMHTTWGAPFTAYSRLLPPNYQDGIWSPRVSVVDGTPLPSPRLISTTIISNIDSTNDDFTLLLMQFGQFISHDFTQSMDMSYANGSAISCCDPEGYSVLPLDLAHFSCMPIIIPADDLFFSRFNQGCMNFVRSSLTPNHYCTLGYAQQMNKLTHFLDASSVYGSTPEQTGQLRSFRGGRLKIFKDYGRELLPLSKDPLACLTMEQGSACFESGDTRTNQMITLVVVHTLFHREHNRLARRLESLNPQWDDETLFLEARQILMAEMQVIIYKEFLPAILGNDAMKEFGLELRQGMEYSYDYDPLVNPSIMNEFATAAFRFGHSIVDGQLRVYGPTKMEESIHIPEVMFYPSRMRHQKFMDEILSTLTTQPIQDVDSFMPDALTMYMFRGGNPFGVDLASINIQRGRDHGLRSYNDYREVVGLPRLEDFSEFEPEIAIKLASVYKSVDDIDLWVGGLLEPKDPGNLLGTTFRDIIADQFSRLKKGDRYFFENNPTINPGHFTPEQLQELRKASIARVICDNSDGILLSRQAPHAFRKPDVPGNEFTDCNGPDIPSIDLSFWQN